MSGATYPLIAKMAETIREELKANSVAITDMEGEDDESLIPHFINVDVPIGAKDKIRLSIAYDGWSLTIRHKEGSRSSFGKAINFRSAEEDYCKGIADEVIRAALAFAKGNIAAAVHLENSTPKIAQLYERTANGYEYLTWVYTQNPPTGFFEGGQTGKFYQKDGNYAMHPKCNEIVAVYDTLPVPHDRLSGNTRTTFETIALRSNLEVTQSIKDIKLLKPINQEIVLQDY